MIATWRLPVLQGRFADEMPLCVIWTIAMMFSQAVLPCFVGYGLNMSSSSGVEVLPYPEFTSIGAPSSFDSPASDQFANIPAPPLDMYSSSSIQVRQHGNRFESLLRPIPLFYA